VNPVEPVAPPVERPRAVLRLRPWPFDPRVGVVLPTDHHAIPSAADVATAVATARADGLVALRTGALFPRAAAVFLDAGFHVIDRLALLDVQVADARPVASGSTHRVRPLRRWQHDAAATVDRRAFGELWGNDAPTLREIRGATPAHHARRVDGDGRLAGFAITGAAGRTGYLQRLAVDPELRRRGIAGALVDDAIEWMARRRLVDAVVNTGVTNEAALALYERAGFRRRDEHLVIAELALDPTPDRPLDDGALGRDR
jgi:ribosomal protein S18 acetylase RimI-like enzyme